MLSENKILPLALEDYRWAVDNEQGRDFEDALQVAMAIRTGCSSFITLDANLAKRYAKLPIEIIIPS
jgi:predicted nucleic acid-binding protein